MSEQRFGPLADRYARQYGVDPRLFRLLIRQESGWNPNAASPAGARGLTQVVPRWHPNANLSTPQGQLEYGAKHLASLLKKYGNPRDALAVYNSGRPWSVSQGFNETRNYVTKILGQYGGGGGTAPRSGGAAPADAGAGASPVPASLPAGQLDARKLLRVLQAQSQRSLQGIMPGRNFQAQLVELAQQALPRSMAYQGARTVGAQVAQAGQEVGRSGLTTPGGGWGGAEAPALAIARLSGLPITSQKRDRQMTASGNVSDHWTGSRQSYAVDLGATGSKGDRAFNRIVTALGYPNLQPGQWHNLTIGGYRYQIGWRTPGHFDHIHVGVKKV